MVNKVKAEQVEHVLVFEEKFMYGFSDTLKENKISSISQDLEYLDHIVGSAHFMPRNWVETNTTYKQIIPYVCFFNIEEKKYVSYRRFKGEEKRLDGKISIGIGGHINPIDMSYGSKDIIKTCANREVAEEFGMERLSEKLIPKRKVGVIYNDTSTVGEVHFGVVFLNLIGNEEMDYINRCIPEDCVTEVKLMNEKELLIDDSLEGWSRLIVKFTNPT